MRLRSLPVLSLAVVMLLCASASSAGLPTTISYQGRITDSLGYQIADGRYLIKFTIYDAATGGAELWTDGFRGVDIWKGLFTYPLGDSTPLPPSVFSTSSSTWLGISVGTSPEIMPRTPFLSVPYSYYGLRADTANFARLAERTMQGRDLYHQILDINPYSTTTVPFVIQGSNPSVTLYLYGSEFQGAIAEHTHDGVNSHSHDHSLAVASTSVDHLHSLSLTSGVQGTSHTHGVSLTTGSSGNAHTHSGTTDSYSLAHSHPGSSITSANLAHSHGGYTNWDGAHHHDFIFQGASDGLYLVHNASYTGLAAHGTWDCTAIGSVAPPQSDHKHVIDPDLGSHSHTLTIASWGGNHAHDFTTGSASASHTHSLSGSTATQSASHSHNISGSTGSDDITHSHDLTGAIALAGSGLSYAGVSSAALPTGVSVYVDGVYAAGPFNGAFQSGALDLSAYVPAIGEHTIVIEEAGGTGGRITYNLFVE